MNRKKKIIKGVNRANFYQMIIKSTAGSFASIIGMVRNDPSLENKISVDWIVRLTNSFGFRSTLIQMDLEETDMLHPYPGLSKRVTLKDEWDTQSRSYAKELLWHSGYRESLRDD